MAIFEWAVFASALSATELAKACVAGLIGNRADAGAMRFAEDAVRRLAANSPPENHHVLKAMHVAFIGSLEQMLRACDPVGGAPEDNFSRKALQGFVKSPRLRKLDLEHPDLPVAELELQVRAIYGHQDAGPRARSCEYVIALVQHHTANALSPAHQDVFRQGNGRFLNWADYFDIFFAAQIKTNDNARRILMFERANELIKLASDQAALLDDCRELLDRIEEELAAFRTENLEEHRRTQELILRDKHEQALAEILSGTATATLLERYEKALAIRRQDGTSVSQTEAANFALAGERAAQSEDPRIREIAALIDQGRIVEASDRKAEIAEETILTAARELRDAAYLALPVSPAKAMEHFKRATELNPTDFSSWIELGRLRAQYEHIAAARNCFNAGLQNVSDEWDRMVLHNEFGNLLTDEGQLSEARKEYDAGLAIAERLANTEPVNVDAQRELSVSYNKLGDIEVAAGNLVIARTQYEKSFDIRERLAATEPGNAVWWRDLSVSYNKLGEVEVAMGNLAMARSRFEQGLAIGERLAVAQRGNAQLQRDLSISYEKLGQVEIAAGDLLMARSRFEQCLTIRERLAEAEPGNSGWQRDLSIGYEKLGNVETAAGNLAMARARFEAGLSIRRTLARVEPANVHWRRDLSVSFIKLGDVEMADGNLTMARTRFEESFAITERLVKAEPGNAEWQRDLSVCYNKLGDIAVATGDFAIACSQFEKSLAIRQRLVGAEPGNAEWQRDLSVSLEKLGEVEVMSGNLAQARTRFQDSMEITERLSKTEPGNAEWQRDLVISNYKLGRLAEAEANLEQALAHYRLAEQIATTLLEKWPNHPIFARDLAVVQSVIARLDGDGTG